MLFKKISKSYVNYELITGLKNLVYPHFMQGEKFITNFSLRIKASKLVMASKWLLLCLVSKSDTGTSQSDTSKTSVRTLLQELLTAVAAGKNEYYLLHQVNISGSTVLSFW